MKTITATIGAPVPAFPEATPAPASWTPAMADYLIGLRDSGVTNMWWADTYLKEAFGLTRNQAGSCLVYWIGTMQAKQGAAA